jgi:UTP--glucose-1-phosphate uridylyltransferase
LKIVIAPNAFKGSLSAREAAEAMARGVHRAVETAQVVLMPTADGGDGLLDVLQQTSDARFVPCTVCGPLGNPVEAGFIYNENEHLAVIELASAAGLRLLQPQDYDPLAATTTGVGELMRAALDCGAQRIILGIGGSATNDGGTGMATALGARFLDADGTLLPGNGATPEQVATIELDELDPRLASVSVQVVCDVDNPLTGRNGAAHVFAPQKGATPEQVEQLDAGLDNLASVIEQTLGMDVRNVPGAGAAGGMGAGALAFLHAELKRGAELVNEIIGLEHAMQGASLVLTAEGRLDAQTAAGKAPAAVAAMAQSHGIPCLAVAGSLGDDAGVLNTHGIDALFSLCPGPLTLDDAIEHAAALLADATEQIVRCYLAGQRAANIQKTEGNIMIKKCLFPAAGYGTRFLPATKAMPKEMLPVLDKPLIQYGVEEASDAGMKNIAIITGRGKRAIEDHFDISYELEHQISGTSKENRLDSIRKIIDECTFSYTRQIEMLGLGHAILTGETLIGKEPFGVILADDLCVGKDIGVMAQMVKIYEKYRCSILAIEEVDPDEVHKYGVIAGSQLDENIYMVSSMVEKPDKADAPSNLAIIGRYILTPDIFEILRSTPPGKNGELQITDALQSQASDNMVLAYKFSGQRYDCGSFHGFVDATNYFFDQRDEDD